MTESGSDHHFGLTVSIAKEALKALLLLNGGAATAMIALTGKAGSGPNYTYAVLLFGVGALLTVAAFFAAYFSQLAYSNHLLGVEQLQEEAAQKEAAKHVCVQRIAIVLIALSLVASAWGMIEAFIASS